jgi:hypothetical protein
MMLQQRIFKKMDDGSVIPAAKGLQVAPIKNQRHKPDK